MSEADLNSISVLGRKLLLVEVGGGAQTHLVTTDDSAMARAALPASRAELTTDRPVEAAGDDPLLVRRWAPSTLCGREWFSMAPGESTPLRLWQEVSLAPTCRSCLRVMDGWFPAAEAPAGVGLLAWVVADTVEAVGSAYVQGVPAEHVEAVRRATRKYLRERGFRSQTRIVNGVVVVTSDDAYDAIDPALKSGWIVDALDRIYEGAESDDVGQRIDSQTINWSTWVVEG